jgi:hypothetical protein
MSGAVCKSNAGPDKKILASPFQAQEEIASAISSAYPLKSDASGVVTIAERSHSMSEQDIPPQHSSIMNTLNRRPGLVTFAAAMMWVLFILYATTAFLEFFQGAWFLLSPASVPGGHLWIWGIVDAVFALVALYAAFDILMGGQAGRVIGLVYASFSVVRWFFFLPIAPIAAVVIIAINILIIYGLAAHGEFFRDSSGGIASLT